LFSELDYRFNHKIF